ncbi:TetR family transcriptional regulator C-terminal domain-containing protein [Amnibacterium sp.]|uniref:TetR family transcriptional regulator C-terminal domain-containing protein n=1 Tax=Amnibacterium sp. TaxID=1872496 RepID=UPI002607C121|nr:TetR family transcriptional regulator C-terminal domain-containing protein [Amnibacterium sp.]MCU1475201.1 TetR family transcriptional regulator [Amnibacterium sp.]
MRRKPAQVGIDELVEAAVAVAFDQGLHAVSPDSVGARAGTTPKVVLHHRPDTAAFIAEVFQKIVGAELAEVKRVVLAHPAPTVQLSALLETLALPVRMDVDSVWLESWSLGRRNPALGAAVRAEEGAWHAFVSAVIRRGVRSGDFLPADPETVAHLLLAVIDGVNAYSLVGYHSEIDRMRLLTSVVRSELGVTGGVEPAEQVAQA